MSKQERIAECKTNIKLYLNESERWQTELDLLQGLRYSAPVQALDNIEHELRLSDNDLAHWRKELETAQAMPDDTAQVDNTRLKIVIGIIQTAINEINIAMPKQRVMGSETYRIDQLIQVILDKSRKDS